MFCFCFVLFYEDTEKDQVQVFLTTGVENNYTFITQGNKIAVSLAVPVFGCQLRPGSVASIPI